MCSLLLNCQYLCLKLLCLIFIYFFVAPFKKNKLHSVCKIKSCLANSLVDTPSPSIKITGASVESNMNNLFVSGIPQTPSVRHHHHHGSQRHHHHHNHQNNTTTSNNNNNNSSNYLNQNYKTISNCENKIDYDKRRLSACSTLSSNLVLQNKSSSSTTSSTASYFFRINQHRLRHSRQLRRHLQRSK